MEMVTVLAYDLGASNGRLTAQIFDGTQLHVEEIHRFSNEPLAHGAHFYWDYEKLVGELHRGLELAVPYKAAALGIDTWGVDFGLLGQNGKLLQNPFSYRDTHSAPFVERVQALIHHYDLYRRTGNEISSINTLFQLMAIAEQSELLHDTTSILMMPNLLAYTLSGEVVNELTICSTTQLLSLETKNWDTELISKLFSKPLPLADIGVTHQLIGKLQRYPEISMALVPGHDTACALSALPIEEAHSIFISLGTWGLIGTELDEPVISSKAFQRGFTNEATSERTIRFQKNATGFWILQRLRKEWQDVLTFEEERRAYQQAPAFQAIINPEDELFFNPTSMKQAIRQFCEQTNQQAPSTKGELIRCFSESVALYYAVVIEEMEQLTGDKSETVYIGGGGTQNELLCQLIANAAAKRVVAGPVEASSIGNGLSQLRALGEIHSITEGRALVKASFTMKEYEPQQITFWQTMKGKYKQLF